MFTLSSCVWVRGSAEIFRGSSYYRISRPIGRTFLPEKCDLNSTCVLCTEGKYYFQTYKYPYIYYTTSLSWDSENNHKDDFSGSDDDFLGFCDE